MGELLTLRMMEKKKSLVLYKKLTKIDNRKLLDDVINQYCDFIDLCSTYDTILNDVQRAK